MIKLLYPLYSQGKLNPQSEATLQEIAESNAAPLTTLTPQQDKICSFMKGIHK